MYSGEQDGDTVSSGVPLLMRQDFVTTHGLNIVCYIGDVTQTEADGIVTGQGNNMAEVSMVTKIILKRTRISQQKMATLVNNKYETDDLKTGNVYWLDTKSSGIQIKFKIILLAILSNYSKHNAVSNLSDWTTNMRRLYTMVFQEAEKLDLASLAVPLLGSGMSKSKSLGTFTSELC